MLLLSYLRSNQCELITNNHDINNVKYNDGLTENVKPAYRESSESVSNSDDDIREDEVNERYSVTQHDRTNDLCRRNNLTPFSSQQYEYHC